MSSEKIPIAHLSQFATQNPLAVEIEEMDFVHALS